MSKQIVPVAFFLLILVMPYCHVQGQEFQVSTDRPTYRIGETVTIIATRPGGVGVEVYLIVRGPDGSQIAYVPWGGSDEYRRLTMPAVPPAGRYAIELWSRVLHPDAPAEIGASCAFEVVGEETSEYSIKISSLDYPRRVNVDQAFELKVNVQYSFSTSTSVVISAYTPGGSGPLDEKRDNLSGRNFKSYSLSLRASSQQLSWQVTVHAFYWKDDRWIQDDVKSMSIEVVGEEGRPEKFKVSVSVHPPGSGYIIGEGMYDAGATCELIARTDGKTDFEFDHWGGDLSGSTNPAIFPVTKNMNVEAWFKKKSAETYPVTFYVLPSIGLTISVDYSTKSSGDKGYYDKNKSIPITARDQSGYKFSHWEGSDGVRVAAINNPSTVMTVTGSGSLTAVFTKEGQRGRYTVYVAKDPPEAGYVTGGESYDLGDTCRLEAIENEGYEFSHWGGDLGGSDKSKSFTVTNNMNIVAYFKKKTAETCTVRFKTYPSGEGYLQVDGSNTNSQIPGIYKKGSRVIVTAEPTEGHKFSYWNVVGGVRVEDVNEEKTTMSVDGDGELEAIFKSVDDVGGDTPIDLSSGNPHKILGLKIGETWSHKVKYIMSGDKYATITLTITRVYQGLFDWGSSDVELSQGEGTDPCGPGYAKLDLWVYQGNKKFEITVHHEGTNRMVRSGGLDGHRIQFTAEYPWPVVYPSRGFLCGVCVQLP